MKKIIFNFYKEKTLLSALLVFLPCALLSVPLYAAEVVARPVSENKSVSARARPVLSVSPRVAAVVATPVADEVIAVEAAPVADEVPVIDSEKSDRFSAALGGASASGANESDLTKLISSQRIADAATITATSSAARTAATTTSGRNACDENLRTCMKEKCGDNFANCALDTDMLWGEKIESCRLTAKCTGAEYAAFAPEIKADRDAHQLLGGFVQTQDCGARYNECVVSGCGTQLGSCLSKTAGDKVISDCNKIAEECRTADSGLAGRTMQVFGTLRQDAQKQVVTDEAEFYALREKMAERCKGIGAMFDDRSFDCVFSAEFWAPDTNSPMASRKLYAGKTFDCTQDWFGVDVTTYLENANRITRDQQGTTDALLGAGAGTLAGTGLNAVMGGGFGTTNLQNDTNNADAAYQQECESQGGTIKNGKCDTSSVQQNKENAENKLEDYAAKAANKLNKLKN